MATWTQQLSAQPGNYTPILSTITQGDGECLQAIYDKLSNHADTLYNSLYDYVVQGLCVAIDQDGVIINPASISTLKAVGLIITSDNVHIGLTLLGYGFMQEMSTN